VQQTSAKLRQASVKKFPSTCQEFSSRSLITRKRGRSLSAQTYKTVLYWCYVSVVTGGVTEKSQVAPHTSSMRDPAGGTAQGSPTA
jgi:hypothetical protein